MSTSQQLDFISQSPTPPFKHKRPSPGAFAFTTIPAHDIPRAQKFYASAFNWIFWAAPGGVTIFNNGGEVMGRIRSASEGTAGGEKGGKDGIVLYVLVEDVDETVKKIGEAGGEIVKAKWVEGNHTEMAEFRDTEGNRMGVLRWLM
jgi:uncharacterized protein